MKFTKMQGAGNDYIYINGFEAIPPHLSSLAVKMSDRHFGVGSDGLVMIVPSKTCDFGMRMFNADGTEAEMCGNAARCVGKYLYDHGMTDKTELTLETLAGVKRIYLTVAHGRVTSVKVDMGEPRLLPGDLPVLLPGDRVVAQPIEVCGHRFSMTCVSMGNPHAVIFLDDLQAYDLHAIGRAIEHHELFPRRTNVEFVKVLAPDVLQMRVWERGAGETLACGTGACASLVAAVLNDRSRRAATLRLVGGDLQIEWDETSNHVFMTGDAVTVFEGTWLE
ncbi:MAG TPA: diaminopimelate epimerase [Candidatus Barnesiella excrementipullorum]|uniref:Diaminopimelate epimerase n=1 Tax=Candidatus Barnesiella excrementipullorum TaxID=2838479 RepID=A0A9D2AQ70_9BACT|nr:diaminopimelate epimerase [Candidatus Barnesiella excrementipullorum]